MCVGEGAGALYMGASAMVLYGETPHEETN